MGITSNKREKGKSLNRPSGRLFFINKTNYTGSWLRELNDHFSPILTRTRMKHQSGAFARKTPEPLQEDSQ